MKNIFFIFLCVIGLCMVGCSVPSNETDHKEKSLTKTISNDRDWEIWTQIKATLNVQDNGSVILTYHLGPILILDNITVTKSWVYFIRSDKPLYLYVYVSKGNSDYCNREGLFKYYVEGNLINPTSYCSPIDIAAIEQRADEIPGFKWLDGTVSTKTKSLKGL